jgi:flagellar basal body P-ring formation protein FlgA
MKRIPTMIRRAIRSALLLLALGIPAITPAVSPALAQSERPALRATATVAGDVVRIGDLIENAGPVADIPVFRAPDLGTTGAVSTDRVIEAIRPHQLIDIDTRGLAEVVVTRASRTITPQEISDRIARALSTQYQIGDAHDISLNFDLPVHPLEVESRATGDLQVLALNYDARSGRFDVTLVLPSSLVLQRHPEHLTGIAIQTVDAVTVDHPIERGEVLQESELTVLRRPKAQSGGLADMKSAIGQAARRQLRPGQPIQVSDLVKPNIVQRNDTVTLVYEAPGLVLTLRGQAQESGALGDTISVLNAQTKRVVQGVVSGPGRVMVANATMHLSQNVPESGRAVVAPERQE